MNVVIDQRPSTGPYRLLLLFFPREMRDAFGDDMHALFAEQLARTRGPKRARLVGRALIDAVRHGVAERIASSQQRPPRVARRWWMDMFSHDLRYALRTLLRQPGTAAAILLTLALGIGANTAVFSVVQAVLLRPLPYREPGNLVMIWERRPAEGVDDNVVSPADFLDWARMNSSFETMAAFTSGTADLTGAERGRRIRPAERDGLQLSPHGYTQSAGAGQTRARARSCGKAEGESCATS